MAYLGLARKWRPQTFDDLVGQAHIARTISNAIKSSRVGHGYLFTGTRGIGKTSAARIFAKALRCQQPDSAGVPCGKCTDCVEISEGRSVDVLEIDGASNNGVDAIREIRENAKYLPSSGTRKIYIIDEVHMLTTAAFNALLKTLEEPPAHVVFVFATTDPQKIPATVLSRCQRFDFKRVSQKDLTKRLEQICAAEKITVAPDALPILVREAEGSMRDAISLLDQILSVGTTSLTADAVTEALGLVDKKTILECVSAILKRKPLQAVEAVGKVHLHGFDLKQFGREILACLRQIIVARLLEENAEGAAQNLSMYLDISDVDLDDLKELLHERSVDDLDMLFRLLNHGLEDVARSAIPKMVMDILVIKMAATSDLVCISDLGSTGGGAEKNRVEAPAPVATVAPVRAQSQAAQVLAQLQAPTPTPLPEQLDTTKKNVMQPETAAGPTGPALTVSNSNDWTKTVTWIKEQRPLLGSILEHLSFEGLTEPNGVATLTLGHTKDHAFYRDQLQSNAYRDLLSQFLKKRLGRALRLDYKEVLSNRSIEELEHERRVQLEEKRRNAVLDSDALKATERLLGARLEKLDINQHELGD